MLGELGPAGVADPDPVPVGEPDRVQHLAVDVELELVGGAVADPHRPGAGVALEVVEGLLVQVGGAVDPVHDLQRPGPLAGLLLDPVAQPAHERRGLLGEPESEQRMDREGGVPDPGVAVVPVALAADLLGQAGGGRGDQGAGRGVGHQLEGDGRAVDHLPPAAPVGRAGQPAPPEPGRLGEHGQQLLGGQMPWWRRRRPTPAPPRPTCPACRVSVAAHVVAVPLAGPARPVQGQLQCSACGTPRPCSVSSSSWVWRP